MRILTHGVRGLGEEGLVVYGAGLGPNAPAWARLGRARAHENVEPGPGRQLGLGSGFGVVRLDPCFLPPT